MIVHFVQFGLVACEMDMPPAVWPEDHRWSSELKDVTCNTCKWNAINAPPTFMLIPVKGGRTAIECRICGAVSHNQHDVEHHFCWWCKAYHDDLWPPARAMLIGHPEKIGSKPWPGKHL
jgi:hypothetical protein